MCDLVHEPICSLCHFFAEKLSDMKELMVPQDHVEEIGNLIQSADSPVGIDAKKTHIIIIEKLLDIEKRLQSIERALSK